MIKRRIGVAAVALVVLLAFVGFNLLASGTARAQTNDDGVHAPTIASLEACVKHCADQGFINNEGVTNSLLAKLTVGVTSVGMFGKGAGWGIPIASPTQI